MAQAAKAQFQPLTKAHLQQARTRVENETTRLEQRLLREGPNGKAWKSYLRLDSLTEQLRQPVPDTEVLSGIWARLASGQEGLELAWFSNVRHALRQYLEVASGVDNPGLKNAYEQRLEVLANQLTEHAKHPTPEGATDLSESLAWLESAHQAPALVQALRSQFGRPNFHGQIAGGVLAAGIAEAVDRTEPIYDVILGTVIHGMGRTVGHTTAPLVADPCFGVFDTVLLATNYSQNVGRNGPVCIYSRGTTGIGATKRFWIDEKGMHSFPAVSRASAKTTITDIAAKRQIIERVAWRKAGKQQSQAEAIASRHAEQRVNNRIDEEAAPMLDQANRDYQEKLRDPLSLRNAFPRQLCFNTTGEVLEITGMEAESRQLAAPTAPPPLSAAADIALRVHQSMPNNLANTVLAGMAMREDMLQATIKSLLGAVPERLKPKPDQEPWTIVFARRDPISVLFSNGGFEFTLRGREYYAGDNKYPGMYVTAKYQFVSTPQGPKAVRQGDLEIFPPGFKPGSGQQLSVRQQAIRTLLKERLDPVFQSELVPEGFTLQGRWAAAGKFMPVEMTTRDGWLVIGWRRGAR